MNSESVEEKRCDWPTKTVRNRFCEKYNIKYDNTSSTRFSKRGYMAQVVPSLMFSKALQHAFKIQAGEGRIRNIDESMCFTYNTAAKTWTV